MVHANYTNRRVATSRLQMRNKALLVAYILVLVLLYKIKHIYIHIKSNNIITLNLIKYNT